MFQLPDFIPCWYIVIRGMWIPTLSVFGDSLISIMEMPILIRHDIFAECIINFVTSYSANYKISAVFKQIVTQTWTNRHFLLYLTYQHPFIFVLGATFSNRYLLITAIVVRVSDCSIGISDIVTVTGASFQYPIRRLIVRFRKVSKARYMMVKCLYRFAIWQVPAKFQSDRAILNTTP